MKIGWKIVCASGAVSRIEECFAQLCKDGTIRLTQQLQVTPYWKAEECCVVTCQHSAPQTFLDGLIPLVSRISGTENVNHIHQGEGIEYSACVSIEEILSDEQKAFVVCFANMKES